MLVILFEDLVRDTAAVMRDVARFLGVDPERFPLSAFERAHHPFEESRGLFARWLLRRRSIRVWSKRWIPQGLRTEFRNRFLFTSGKKPTIDEESREFLLERFEPDLQRLEKMLGRDLGKLRKNG